MNGGAEGPVPGTAMEGRTDRDANVRGGPGGPGRGEPGADGPVGHAVG